MVKKASSASSTPEATSTVSSATAMPLSQPAKPLPPLPETYEAALSELEQLVARMESGALPLDHLLVGYERGAQLLGHCRQRLEAVEAQVKRLEDGQLKPWDAA